MDNESDETRRTEEVTVTDVTRGHLLTSLIQLAWPSVLQAVLSNCYAFNDFMFVGRISDKAESSAATAALAATVGLQVIMFAFHNCVPSGANTFTAQNRGAKDFQRLAVIFKSAFLACFFVSSLMAIVGYTQIRHIAGLVNAETQVEAAISDFFGLSFLGAPAFGFLLLIDGFFKSNGDTRTPLGLEIASLIINTVLNYVLILHFNWGIKGAAIATIISKFIPAVIGLYKILRGDLGFSIPLLTSYEDMKIMLRCATDMIKIGVFESIAYLIYGFVFTLLIRLSGQLGYAQQAGLGAGMRGLGIAYQIFGLHQLLFLFLTFNHLSSEWIAFCLSEGFLVAACSSVGQCIGAKMYHRAMLVKT
jgi:putative MATE family efflux protein